MTQRRLKWGQFIAIPCHFQGIKFLKIHGILGTRFFLGPRLILLVKPTWKILKAHVYSEASISRWTASSVHSGLTIEDSPCRP